MILQDIWTVPATPNPTHDFGGAANVWASVTIENDTNLQIVVNPQQGNPPAGLADAWRLIPPGANVTWPLYSNGVSYRVLGTPAAGGAVQTVLSSDPVQAGGSTGSVNVASGTITVTGPVSVQNAAGINLTALAPFDRLNSIPLVAGTTTTTLAIDNNVQQLFLLVSGASTNIGLIVSGNTTFATYFDGFLANDDSFSLQLPGAPNADPNVDFTIFYSGVGGSLIVCQTFAPPGLSTNDIYPADPLLATQLPYKNIFVYEAGGKSVVQAAVVGASQNVILIPAPGAPAGISLQHITYYSDTVSAGSFLQIGGGPAANNPTIAADPAIALGTQFHIPMHGMGLPTNTRLTAITNVGATPTWRIKVVYAVLSR